VSRSQFDTDDEVRDRATFYLSVLNQQQKTLNLTYIINGTPVGLDENHEFTEAMNFDACREF